MSNIRAIFSINAAGTVWGAIDGDISNQTDLQDALDLKADKSELETDIEEVNTAISNLSDTVLDNYNTLDNKIDTEISNRVTADEDLQDNIDTLSNTVTNNYTELNNKILDNTADITTNTSSITNINSKIPEQASAVNQLADKNFVNSSIATNTANFIGTFNSIAELEAYSGTLTNNDYAFVATTDSVGNTLYDRYKWNGSEWLFEYELNNSSFTANQWASINSGITNTLTAQITTNQNSIINIQNNYVPNIRTINGKALNTNITLNASDVNALANTTTINDLTTTAQQNALNSGVTSAKISQIATNTGNITTNANAISTINGKIPTDASSNNKLVTASALSNAVVNLANQDLSNLTETGNDRLHALKGYSDNGELLTDAEGLNDVIKYAHSTFDLSKFTVVGSPTITDDGILTLANNSNCIYKQINYFGDANNFDIIFPLYLTGNNTSDVWDYRDLLNLRSGNSNVLRLYSQSRNSITTIVCRMAGNNDTIYGLQITPALDLNQQYLIKISKKGNTYGVYYKTPQTGWTLFEPNRLITSSDTLLDFDSLRFTQCSSYERIDLKQFSITVDGVEVFSGNKTGIDTIKSDNYSIIGNSSSVIITDDGILKQSYATTTPKGYPLWDSSILPTPDGKHIYRFEQKWSINNNNTINYFMCIPIVLGTDAIFAINSRQDKYIYLSVSNGVSNIAIKTSKQINTNTIYNTVIETDFTTFLRCLCDGEIIYENMNYAFPSGYVFRNLASFSCYYNFVTSNYDFSGENDLNAFKIYVDGNLVYQPCLKIPYTESKTGSKIVNAVYRDRVNDMAEQFGYANYYTLDEDNGNFTLPQVELFGLIGDKTLRDSYYNGATYWELYSNRRLEQGGSCESGVEYTLPKPFADTNYILTIPYSSKTATSFIPSATGDFIAKGTGLL